MIPRGLVLADTALKGMARGEAVSCRRRRDNLLEIQGKGRFLWLLLTAKTQSESIYMLLAVLLIYLGDKKVKSGTGGNVVRVMSRYPG